MISDLIRQLIMNAEQEKIARDFWEEVEREAEKLEVTVDYYLAEFYIHDFYSLVLQLVFLPL
jgi:hypothetical protein